MKQTQKRNETMNTFVRKTPEGLEMMIRQFEASGYDIEIAIDVDRPEEQPYHISASIKKDGQYFGTVIGHAKQHVLDSLLISTHFLRQLMVNGNTAVRFWERVSTARWIKRMITDLSQSEYDVVDLSDVVTWLYSVQKHLESVADALKELIVRIDTIVLTN